MTPTPEVHERLKLYLLGQLADDARGEIETNLLAHDQLFEELLVIEDEIIDDYLGGKLNSSDRAAFEHHFLATPERHEQLKFAQILNRYVTTAGRRQGVVAKFLPAFLSRQSTAIRTASIAMIIAVLAGALWFFRNQRTSPETFATLSLTVTQGTRAEGPQMPSMKLPIAQEALKIIMTLPEPSPTGTRFRAQLETASGDSRTLEAVMQDNRSVAVTIPAAELRAGQYSIKLFAVSDDGREQRLSGSYLFTLE